MVKYNYILTKGREAVKDNEKQVFTRREIEIDLKNVRKFNLSETVILFLFTGLMTSIVLFYGDVMNIEGKTTFTIICLLTAFILLALITVGIFCAMIYNIYRCLQPLKYEIVSSVYECRYIKHYYMVKKLHFSFKFYGDYPIDSEVVKYKWLKDVRINGYTILKTIKPGDEFYLIMVNNKIAYIYSKRMFKFKETM